MKPLLNTRVWARLVTWRYHFTNSKNENTCDDSGAAAVTHALLPDQFPGWERVNARYQNQLSRVEASNAIPLAIDSLHHARKRDRIFSPCIGVYWWQFRTLQDWLQRKELSEDHVFLIIAKRYRTEHYRDPGSASPVVWTD